MLFFSKKKPEQLPRRFVFAGDVALELATLYDKYAKDNSRYWRLRFWQRVAEIRPETNEGDWGGDVQRGYNDRRGENLMKRKPILGETLYARDGYRGYLGDQLIPVVVTKVGRRYFTCTGEGERCGTDYHLDTWRERTNYTPRFHLYESPQQREEEKERTETHGFITGVFRDGSRRKPLRLESLRRIKAIIEEDGDAEDKKDSAGKN